MNEKPSLSGISLTTDDARRTEAILKIAEGLTTLAKALDQPMQVTINECIIEHNGAGPAISLGSAVRDTTIVYNILRSRDSGSQGPANVVDDDVENEAS